MGIKRSRILAIEAFNTVNNFNNKFHAKLGPDDILVNDDDTSIYGTKSLTISGPKTWNQLPKNIKSERFYFKFKE